MVIECGDYRVKLQKGDRYLVFEQDCDPDGCTESQVDDKLMTCHWNPTAINAMTGFSDFNLYFEDDQQLIIEGANAIWTGTWITYGNPYTGVFVEISQFTGDFEAFNGAWKVVECTETQLIFHGPDGREMVLDRACDVDTPNNVATVMIDGQWLVANYNDSGVDETTDFANWILEFFNDGTVTATNNNVINGTWETYYDSGELKLKLNFGEQVPFDEFNDDWDVFSLGDMRIELRDISGGDGTLDVLVLEKF